MIVVTTGKYKNPNKSPGILQTKHVIPCYTASEAPKLRTQTIDSSIGTVRVPHRTSVQRQSWHFELLSGPRDSRGASLCWCCPPGPAKLSPIAASTDLLPRAQRRPPWAHCQIWEAFRRCGAVDCRPLLQGNKPKIDQDTACLPCCQTHAIALAHPTG
jgi:hypothetical protein